MRAFSISNSINKDEVELKDLNPENVVTDDEEARNDVRSSSIRNSNVEPFQQVDNS